MDLVTLSQQDQLRHSQNDCLYKSVILTGFGTFIASMVVFVSLYGKSDLQLSVCWMVIVNITYAGRVIDSRLFFKDLQSSSRSHAWQLRYGIGSFCGALAWATCIWFMFPEHNIQYAALLVIAISAVGASALASTPYRPGVLFIFLSILGAGLVFKLVMIGEPFAWVLAIYSLTIFCFLLSSGFRISANFDELLRMKLDSQNANSTMISVTEDMAKMGYWSWKKGSEKIELSESLCRLLGLTSTEVDVREILDCVHPDDKSRVLVSLESFRQGNKSDQDMIECQLDNKVYDSDRIIRVLAKPIRNINGEIDLFGTVQDITQFRDAEQKIYRMAYYDALTNLANRAYFLERLDEQAAKASRADSHFAILYIDIDNFKEVNDTFGHKSGDAYLKNFASYLSDTLGPYHFVARLGGDEFCILLRDVQDYESVQHLIKGFDDYKNQKLHLGPYSIFPEFSIGVALFPEHGSDPDTLVKHADLAMYNAKQLIDSDMALYDVSMSAEVTRRLQVEGDIREGLASDEFELWYQPKVDFRNNKIAGFEALVRWRKDGEIIRPDDFIPIAETVGLINDIGEWVLHKASAQMEIWNKLGHKPKIAVNISSNHFSSDSFIPTVEDLLEKRNIDPQDLEIEITESLSRDPESQSTICENLKTQGVCIAIDDFGTGYSSLSLLADLQADTLKIDQSFVKKLPYCDESGIIVKAIIDLARGLDFSIVAEGVESAEQFRYLDALGCHYAQGYFCGKPMPAGVATKLLASGALTFDAKTQGFYLDDFDSKAA